MISFLENMRFKIIIKEWDLGVNDFLYAVK